MAEICDAFGAKIDIDWRGSDLEQDVQPYSNGLNR
jgi:hypothetical protein